MDTNAANNIMSTNPNEFELNTQISNKLINFGKLEQEGNVLGPINAPWQLLILAIDFFKSLDPDLNPLDERMSHRLLAWQSHYIGALCFFYIDFSADFPFSTGNDEEQSSRNTTISSPRPIPSSVPHLSLEAG
ncbi:hypothetical protein Tco_0757029 [Tanacetum coccineum]